MSLNDYVLTIDEFSNWKYADQIRFFAWYLHEIKKQERFNSSDINACFDELAMSRPSSVSPFLDQMTKRKPKEALRNSKGYILEKRLRDRLNAQYGKRTATIKADTLLTELPSKIPTLIERVFLDETIKCFRAGAFRAAIVMTWNLSYYHLCDYIIRKHLLAFNTQWPISFQKQYAKARVTAVAQYDDFAELKESEVIQICRSANLITNDVSKILKEKLDKRNSAAHPSSVTIAPHTAEEYIIDIVTNVVLKLV